jgi:hypothetical protein
MFAWVQCCPDCGYCATNVSKPLSISSSIIRSDDYQSRLSYPTFPELANAFLCQSLLARESGELIVSAMASMHAAWVCDDGDYAMQSRACRLQAATLIRIADDKGKSISKQNGVSTAIRVDLLRRAGALDEARELIAMEIDEPLDDVIKRILSFQSALLDRNDTGCHTIEEAMKGRR